MGRADLSEAALADVREALVATGARADVEARADRLMRQAERHLDRAGVEAEPGHRLLGLLRSVAGSSPGPGAHEDVPEAAKPGRGAPASSLRAATGGGTAP
ncbi:hypothetical protein [Streptomyces sp. IBSBF 2435]|uniref:hypothetical protein n=1 Tax=Streptomyces sp. IBSBF 2435 TaxID=2903531 RepID=UPI002FDC4DF9